MSIVFYGLIAIGCATAIALAIASLLAGCQARSRIAELEWELMNERAYAEPHIRRLCELEPDRFRAVAAGTVLHSETPGYFGGTVETTSYGGFTGRYGGGAA